MWYQWRSDKRSNSGNILKVDGWVQCVIVIEATSSLACLVLPA